MTVGEEEGGVPDIAAIGFANADRDRGNELIVLLSWSQQHYDVSGTLYEVRVFNDPQPGLSRLKPLNGVTAHFDRDTCDCSWRDGHSAHFRFKTIAAIKKELKKMGF